MIALAEEAGLLVVGLSERWRQEGLGRVRERARRGASRADRAGPAGGATGRARAAGDGHPLRLVADGRRAVSDAIGPGSTFAGYRVESLIGRGGMGVVYRATDVSLERPVALKLIAPELAEDERFRRALPEGAAARRRRSTTRTWSRSTRRASATASSTWRCATCRAATSRRVLERERTLAPERALAVLAQVAGALDAAHRRGLVHRDVKPANVLLDEDEHAYLTDFGVTKQAGGASTDTGQVVGTLDYLAPEQIRGEPVDARSDGYALACVLYECLSGEPPFRRATAGRDPVGAPAASRRRRCAEYPALDPVLGTALAKEQGRALPELRASWSRRRARRSASAARRSSAAGASCRGCCAAAAPCSRPVRSSWR